MKKTKAAKKAHVEIERAPDGELNRLALYIESADGADLTGQQILEAVSEALLLYWDNNPLEEANDLEFDA